MSVLCGHPPLLVRLPTPTSGILVCELLLDERYKP
jgi:hypothetical protein